MNGARKSQSAPKKAKDSVILLTVKNVNMPRHQINIISLESFLISLSKKIINIRNPKPKNKKPAFY